MARKFPNDIDSRKIKHQPAGEPSRSDDLESLEKIFSRLLETAIFNLLENE